MKETARQIYEFGRFRLDPWQRVLFRDAKALSVTPKALDTLLVLLENHGQIVDKEEILNRVWPGTFIEEATLAQNISLLRKVLGEDHEVGEYIQTVPKRGYRFAASVLGYSKSVSQESIRLSIVLPADAAVALEGFPALALSPDGTSLVYVARAGVTTKLFARKFTQLTPHAIPGTEGATGPFFSPDGKWIGFFACGKLKRVSATAGPPMDLCAAPEGRGAVWGADGIIFAPSPAGALWKIDPAGGPARQVTTLDSERREVTHRWPEVLPNGKSILFTVGLAGASDYEDARIAVQCAEGTGHRTLIQGGTQPRYLPSGHLAFAKSGAIVGVPFDANRVEVSGYPIPVIEAVLTESTGACQWSASLSGTVAYISGGLRSAQRNLVFVSRNGAMTPLDVSVNIFEEPRLSPDGKRLAFGIRGRSNDIWVLEIARGTLTRLTLEGDNFAPIWSPEGTHIVFSSNRLGPSSMFSVPADGSAEPKLLLSGDHDQVASSFSADGKLLAFTEYRPNTGADIWLLPTTPKGTPRIFLQTSFNEWEPVFSPDSRWLTYTSDQSGRPEIYVQALKGQPRYQISIDGGHQPAWSRDGKELYFRKDDKFFAVSIKLAPGFCVGTPKLLFSGRYLGGSGEAYLANYDVCGDGKRFVMIKEVEQNSATEHVHVMFDWFSELKGQWSS